MAITNIAYDDANNEVLRPHIGFIVGLVQQHAREAEVTEEGLATIVCTIYVVCMFYTLYMSV